MNSVLGDTHALIWYALEDDRLSRLAAETLDKAAGGGTIYISAITFVEIIYLIERGRVPSVALERLLPLAAPAAGTATVAPVDLATTLNTQRIPRDVVPDMPDRIIAATALTLGVPLVTCDERFRRTEVRTIW